MIFYNRHGQAVVNMNERGQLFSFQGHPLGYIKNDVIFTYQGQHLGWLHNGWIRDSNGHAVFYGDHPTGGPIPPIRKIAPIPAIPQLPPIPSLPPLPPLRPLFSSVWSQYVDTNFFHFR
ncbi:4-fold beta flower protein [Desulfovibrio sp.]|uniref:4-fold beta flower protein n=1 Tax=Desulfovibrio sp. TaxID=885 RepID=UPI0039C8BDE9